MNPSDEIKTRLDIVDIIRDYIQLRAAGVNFRALCPFHKEKTPSFMVSPDKQIWHCFGCGKGGDMFSFVMEMEGLSFVEALRQLAPKAGVKLKRGDPKLASQRNRLLDIIDLASKHYHKILLESKEAESVRKYLNERGLKEDTIHEWNIGYSPDKWEYIMNWLKDKGFNENEIFLAGMSVRREKRPGFYDRFRGRIMFPLSDVNGNSVAFSARVSPSKEAEEKMGKYINSPQTITYDKSRIIFGLDKAKLEIKQSDLAVLVEGQMDVITAYQHGYKNVVATSGTALTKDQVKLLSRYTKNIALAFDMDAAGEQAARRGAREAMLAEMSIKIISLPKGSDPDELIRKNPTAWQEAVDTAENMMGYYLDLALINKDIANIDDKRLITKEFLPLIAQLGNKIEQDHWLKQLAQTIQISESVLRETLETIIKPVPEDKEETREEPAKAQQLSREEKMGEIFLALLIKFNELIEHAANNINVYHFSGEVFKSIYKNLILYYNNTQEERTSNRDEGAATELNYESLKAFIKNNNDDDIESQLKALEKLVLLGDKDYYDFSVEQAKAEIMNITLYLKKNYLLERMKEVESMIAQSEKVQDKTRSDELMKEFKALVEEFRGVGE